MLHPDDEIIERHHDAADAGDLGQFVQHAGEGGVGTDQHALVCGEFVGAQDLAAVRLGVDVGGGVVAGLLVTVRELYPVGAGV